MGTRPISVIAGAAWILVGTLRAVAAVDLDLRPGPQPVPVGRVVEIGLFAVSDDGTDQMVLGLVVLLTWDPTQLELNEVVDNGPHTWGFMFGFVPDSALDGLNDSLLDGDARFEAGSFSAAPATADGLLVATLRFTALSGGSDEHVVIEAELGEDSVTQVFQPGGQDVTGNLGSTSVAIVDLGDGDGNGAIDLRDFSRFQACFTGPVGPVDPPAYSLAPDFQCIVHDFDDDGDIDVDDYSAFRTLMTAPGP